MITTTHLRNALGIAFLLASSLALTACSREPDSNAAASAPPPKPAEMIKSLTLGIETGPNGLIASEDVRTYFDVGQRVYLVAELNKAPPGTTVLVEWKAPAGELLGEESRQVRPGQGFMTFAADTESLPAGKGYRAEVSVNGELAQTAEFNLIGPGSG